MQIRLAFLMIFGAGMLRILPHGYNFSPINAMLLFGAAYFARHKFILAAPLLALFLSDLYLNNVVYKAFFPSFAWITSVWIYASYAMLILIGFLLLRPKVTPARLLIASLTASVVFFLTSNLEPFFLSALYPKNFGGLLMCYTAALPFFQNTILGDLFFSLVMFGLYEWVSRTWPAVQRSEA